MLFFSMAKMSVAEKAVAEMSWPKRPWPKCPSTIILTMEFRTPQTPFILFFQSFVTTTPIAPENSGDLYFLSSKTLPKGQPVGKTTAVFPCSLLCFHYTAFFAYKTQIPHCWGQFKSKNTAYFYGLKKMLGAVVTKD